MVLKKISTWSHFVYVSMCRPSGLINSLTRTIRAKYHLYKIGYLRKSLFKTNWFFLVITTTHITYANRWSAVLIYIWGPLSPQFYVNQSQRCFYQVWFPFFKRRIYQRDNKKPADKEVQLTC